jgi:hypothetical protein
MARGPHPFPFRTRSLSLAARMVLLGRPSGRVRRRRPLDRRPRPLHERAGAVVHLGSERLQQGPTAAAGSSADMTAPMTAAPASSGGGDPCELPGVMPPIPTTGAFTARTTRAEAVGPDPFVADVRLGGGAEDGAAADVVGAFAASSRARVGVVGGGADEEVGAGASRGGGPARRRAGREAQVDAVGVGGQGHVEPIVDEEERPAAGGSGSGGRRPARRARRQWRLVRSWMAGAPASRAWRTTASLSGAWRGRRR